MTVPDECRVLSGAVRVPKNQSTALWVADTAQRKGLTMNTQRRLLRRASKRENHCTVRLLTNSAAHGTAAVRLLTNNGGNLYRKWGKKYTFFPNRLAFHFFGTKCLLLSSYFLQFHVLEAEKMVFFKNCDF